MNELDQKNSTLKAGSICEVLGYGATVMANVPVMPGAPRIGSNVLIKGAMPKNKNVYVVNGGKHALHRHDLKFIRIEVVNTIVKHFENVRNYE